MVGGVWQGGCMPRGGLPMGGRCLSGGGVCPRDVCPWGVSAHGGVYPSMQWGRHLHCEQNHQCKNITLPQTSFADGKKDIESARYGMVSPEIGMGRPKTWNLYRHNQQQSVLTYYARLRANGLLL